MVKTGKPLGELPADLASRRDHECRLTPDRWLTDLGEARAFLADRRLLTTTPSSHLPSLFGACEPVADPQARGFARLPADKWWWDGALTDSGGVARLKVLRGKVLLLDEELTPLVDPLCRASLRRAERGDLGQDAKTLAKHLAATGPLLLEDARSELGWDAAKMRRVRKETEPFGVVVSEEATLDAANGGHLHTSRLLRWDHTAWCGSGQDDPATALQHLFEVAVGAAVAAPTAEAQRWFSWPTPADMAARLVEAGRLRVPVPGWLTTGESA
jgi:hypothetical protein